MCAGATLSPSYLRCAYRRTRSAGVPLWSRRLGVVRLLDVPLLALSTVSIPPSYLAILFSLEPDLTESVDAKSPGALIKSLSTILGISSHGLNVSCPQAPVTNFGKDTLLSLIPTRPLKTPLISSLLFSVKALLTS